MMVGGGGLGFGGWFWMLAGLAFVVGAVLLVAWAVSAAGGGGPAGEDEPLRILRARFAGGELDADQFEHMRQLLGPPPARAGTARAVGLLGLALVAAALLLGVVGAALAPAGPGWGGMMGPRMWQMMGGRPAPTAPEGTSVRMADSRFEPAVLAVQVGETVRWFNDDSVPHTVTAADGSWNSGNLAPGDRFERRFEAPGSHAYLCLYHPGMAGSIEVRAP